jgi:hypothetical protein
LPAVASGNKILLSTQNGRLASFDEAASTPAVFSAMDYSRIDDAAYVGGQVAALVEGNVYRFPANPLSFKQGASIKALRRIDADRLLPVTPERFVYWKRDGTVRPVIEEQTGTSAEIALSGTTPVIAAQLLGKKLLFLDAAGSLTLADSATGLVEKTFSYLGLMDAAFLDERRILLAKSSSVAPFAPLLLLNFESGETAPLDATGKAAIRLHRGASGSVYSVIVDADASGTVTRLSRIEGGIPVRTQPLLEYKADDVQASIAEAGRNVATNLGGDGISVLKQGNLVRLERTPALARTLIAAGQSLLSICDDGSLAWHNLDTGKTEAILRFTVDAWELARDASTLRGKLE